MVFKGTFCKLYAKEVTDLNTSMVILYDDGKTAINVRDSWGFEVGF